MSKNIFLFPGQGAQYIGMGSTLAQNFEPAKKMLEYADEILGFSISKIMKEGPEEVLKSTDNTQPALFVTSMMVMELLISEGITCDMVAGHSLGEYSAICAAGGISFEDGLRLVRKRGELPAAAGTRSQAKWLPSWCRRFRCGSSCEEASIKVLLFLLILIALVKWWPLVA